jgi:hypothetical protein
MLITVHMVYLGGTITSKVTGTPIMVLGHQYSILLIITTNNNTLPLFHPSQCCFSNPHTIVRKKTQH